MPDTSDQSSSKTGDTRNKGSGSSRNESSR
jgi:hypothetical protein